MGEVVLRRERGRKLRPQPWSRKGRVGEEGPSLILWMWMLSTVSGRREAFLFVGAERRVWLRSAVENQISKYVERGM
jgi:hypothetical protein